jgi:hypothetical protein
MDDTDELAVIEIKSFVSSGGGFGSGFVKVYVDGNYANSLNDGGTAQLEVDQGEHRIEVRDSTFGINKSKILTVNASGGDLINLRLRYNQKVGSMVLLQLVLFFIFSNLQKAAVIGTYCSMAMVAMILIDIILILRRGTTYDLHYFEDFRGREISAPTSYRSIRRKDISSNIDDEETNSQYGRLDNRSERPYIDEFLKTSESDENRSMTPMLVVLLIVGVSLFFWYYNYSYSVAEPSYLAIKQNAFSSKHWPTVSGTIKSSHCNFHPDLFAARNAHPYYSPEIIFEYSVAGNRLTSSQISFPNPTFSSHDECERLLGRYPEGASVRVFYDPGNPKQSCLINGVTQTLRRNIHWRMEYLEKPEPE